MAIYQRYGASQWGIEAAEKFANSDYVSVVNFN